MQNAASLHTARVIQRVGLVVGKNLGIDDLARNRLSCTFATPGSTVVLNDPHQDAEDPGLHAATAFEFAKPSMHCDEYFLCYIIHGALGDAEPARGTPHECERFFVYLVESRTHCRGH